MAPILPSFAAHGHQPGKNSAGQWLGFCESPHPGLDHHLCLCACATAVGAVGMTRELEHLVGRQTEDTLEATANRHQDLLALLGRPALAAGDVTVPAAGNVSARGAGPDTDTI